MINDLDRRLGSETRTRIRDLDQWPNLKGDSDRGLCINSPAARRALHRRRVLRQVRRMGTSRPASGRLPPAAVLNLSRIGMTVGSCVALSATLHWPLHRPDSAVRNLDPISPIRVFDPSRLFRPAGFRRRAPASPGPRRCEAHLPPGGSRGCGPAAAAALRVELQSRAPLAQPAHQAIRCGAYSTEPSRESDGKTRVKRLESNGSDRRPGRGFGLGSKDSSAEPCGPAEPCRRRPASLGGGLPRHHSPHIARGQEVLTSPGLV